MSRFPEFFRRGAWGVAALALSAGIALSADAQQAPNAGRQAVETRKAIFTLIGGNFRLFGDFAKGAAPYDAAEADKRLARLQILSDYLKEAFPESSNLGEPDSKARAEIWSSRADFDKKLADFQGHVAALVKVNASDKAATDGFKTAVAAVAQDCKGCHESYRAK